ncbi:terpene cyclase [Steccherinum ochraceum]|uniref:Terpene cyclase n=1 Tax=Steccherinum ochraceum TaxID=92696 RepID=A0A4R0RLE3_9APHY|nr:terpene cyclase [Steccherinum ochraceum]
MVGLVKEMSATSLNPVGPRTMGTPQLQDQPVSLRSILLQFFDRIEVSDRFERHDSLDSLATQMFVEATESWNLGVPRKIRMKVATVGLLIGTVAYRHTPIETQVAVAIYTYLGVMCDDDIMPTHVLREFAPRFFDGQQQLHPILDHFVSHLSILRRMFPPWSATTITLNTMEFVNAEMFVREEGGAEVRTTPEAVEYIDFMRWKNGVGEAFVVMIWPQVLFPETRTYIKAVPYAVQFICLDLLSYHKEAKAGETDNYVSLYASAQQKPVLQVLQDLVERMVEQDRCIKAVLGDGNLSDVAVKAKFKHILIDKRIRRPTLAGSEASKAMVNFEPSTRIVDHIVHLTPPGQLQETTKAWQGLGFTVVPGGTHADGLTENALVAFADGAYIELISFTHPLSYYPPNTPTHDARKSHSWASKHPGFIDFAFLGNAGYPSIAAAINARAEKDGSGAKYAGEVPGGRKRPDGQVLQWLISAPIQTKGIEDDVRGRLPFFCGDRTSRDLRVPHEKHETTHPNTSLGISSIRLLASNNDIALLAKQLTTVVGSSPSPPKSSSASGPPLGDTQKHDTYLWQLDSVRFGNVENAVWLKLNAPEDEAEEKWLRERGAGVYKIEVRTESEWNSSGTADGKVPTQSSAQEVVLVCKL